MHKKNIRARNYMIYWLH